MYVKPEKLIEDSKFKIAEANGEPIKSSNIDKTIKKSKKLLKNNSINSSSKKVKSNQLDTIFGEDNYD